MTETTESALPKEAQDLLAALEEAHTNYDLCNPAQKLWVLSNKPEMLFLPGMYGIAERKLVQKGKRELELFIAQNITLKDIL